MPHNWQYLSISTDNCKYIPLYGLFLSLLFFSWSLWSPSKTVYLFSLCFMTFLSKVLKTRDSSFHSIHNVFCIKTKNKEHFQLLTMLTESKYCSLSISWWNSSLGVLKCTKPCFHADVKIFKNSVKTRLFPRNTLSCKFQLHSLRG